MDFPAKHEETILKIRCGHVVKTGSVTLRDSHAEQCILCNHADFESVADSLRDSDQHRVVRCAACGLTQISPLPSPEEHRQFHASDHQTKNIGRRIEAEELDRRKGWDTARRVKFVAEQVPPHASILDVGSGYGTIPGRLATLGYRVMGIELSEERCQISRQLNDVPIMQADLYALPQEMGRFDAVTLFHVLEHLCEPVRAIQAIRSCLLPQGRVLIEVPNCDELLLEASPAYRSFYWQRAHVMYFTSMTLEAVLRKAGFGHVEIRGVQRYGIENLMAWLLHAKPQLDVPSFETQGPYRWLEDLYKVKLQEWKRCDTLMAVASA